MGGEYIDFVVLVIVGGVVDEDVYLYVMVGCFE